MENNKINVKYDDSNHHVADLSAYFWALVKNKFRNKKFSQQLSQKKVRTLFMTSVRSPDTSSSGVGGNGRFGAPPE